MKIILIDNYDSFTYNLVHYFEGFDCEVEVFRNDEIPFFQIANYDRIVLSPGPGLPKDSVGMNRVIQQFETKIPILGVCLGFQAIVEYYGGELYNQQEVKHGVPEPCYFEENSKLFKGLPREFEVGLYHSWAVSEKVIPVHLKVTARSESGVVMAFEHKELPICGVQFHPESILTQHGKAIVQNFLLEFQ